LKTLDYTDKLHEDQEHTSKQSNTHSQVQMSKKGIIYRYTTAWRVDNTMTQVPVSFIK